MSRVRGKVSVKDIGITKINFDVDSSIWLKQMDDNWNRLVAFDQKMKEEGSLVGRYIAEPYADGKAIYLIVGVTKTKAKIQVVTNLGDDWIIPYWGESTSIDLDYAVRCVKFRDNISAKFSKKGKAG